MRFQATALAFAASLAIVGAQDLSSVPQCAIPCFVAAIPGSGCQVTDIKCQCTTGKDAIQSSLTSCAPQKCSASDAAAIIPAVSKICSAAGVSISVPAASGAASSAAAAASGAMSSAMGSTTRSAMASATQSAPAQQSTAAGAINVVGVGAVAMGLAAALI